MVLEWGGGSTRQGFLLYSEGCYRGYHNGSYKGSVNSCRGGSQSASSFLCWARRSVVFFSTARPSGRSDTAFPSLKTPPPCMLLCMAARSKPTFNESGCWANYQFKLWSSIPETFLQHDPRSHKEDNVT